MPVYLSVCSHKMHAPGSTVGLGPANLGRIFFPRKGPACEFNGVRPCKCHRSLYSPASA
jgi:hypothetical protein